MDPRHQRLPRRRRPVRRPRPGRVSRPDPDSCAPLPSLPACATCGHPLVAHGRRGCRADVSGLRCGCTHYTDPVPDASEEPPADDLPHRHPGPPAPGAP
ncbi:conserved hypothetical protein [Frankia canadensis]|uniref:Uncharacterized protein n=1 Tax=Frankia canadensis TaxID=1836972 RepID=A0A2I2L164_9ACTN|nr:conserved hypothetical protein [Frankia canadensis]SOU58940.1 conserved hypothetical protein [Frankia canadensis]